MSQEVDELLKEVSKAVSASNAQTAVSQELAQDVAGKMGQIDKKADDAIARAEAAFDSNVGDLVDYSVDGHKKAVEDMSGGKNTVIIDAQGNPNVMVRIPMCRYEELAEKINERYSVDLALGTGIPTMFLTEGVPRSEVLVGKYLASAGGNGGCAVVGGVQPRTLVDYDTAKALCAAKGAGWHLFSVHEWAFIALWAYANQTVPRGNTNYGRSHENKLEVARRYDDGMPGDVSGTARTDTGKGPDTWAHDHTSNGIHDLVGNVWEWLDQMMLIEGQIAVSVDNSPEQPEAQWPKVNAFLDSTNNAQEGSAGSPILNSVIANRNGQIGDDAHGAYASNSHFAAITKSATYVELEILRRLLVESASSTTVAGGIYARNYGTRPPFRGGHWGNGASAGLGALYLNDARSNSGSSLGFRPAFFE